MSRLKKSSENPLVGSMDPALIKVMDEIKDGLQYIFQTSSPYVFCVSGVGHVGLEATICNLLEPDEVFLVCSNGIWGERAAEIAIRQGMNVEIIRKSAGEIFHQNDVKSALIIHKPAAMFLTHVESSSCVLQDLEDIGHICHRYGTFLIVDGVSSIVATPFLMDRWGIDVAYTSTNEVLNSPAGLAPVALSTNAMNKIKLRKTKCTTTCLDFNIIANFWGCNAEERRYHHPFPEKIAHALRESLSSIVMKGLEWHWKRQLRVRDLLIEGIEKLGYKMFISNHDIRAPTVTAVTVPDGVPWRKVTRYLLDRYQIQILGGLGPTAGLIFRISLVGQNCEDNKVRITVDAFHSAVQKFTKCNS